MKPIVIKELVRVTRCELFMCGTMATHSIATPDSPPGQCFLLCLDHMRGMQAALRAMASDAVVEAEPCIVTTPVVVPEPVVIKPAVSEKSPEAKPNLAGAAAGWDEGQKKRNALPGDTR